MPNLPNIEKSAFRAGDYVGWRASDGARYRIRKGVTVWLAVRYGSTGQAGDRLTAPTLTGLSERLAQS